ncbi:hypothetical protein W97_07981 [Coniosporium apollinis CBS 100218]|uniref:Uncharacterized protein n=1 Tax=Coniosporium apollinis (strain CBS 100218) TaxID=1168221 RepID=R7Z3Q2_CONA1|nr:uncharacterized protein W97_07981 [Coniosporium apollinis CBS 100218]EON68723.1 hypothetical protein W97_07981 [Coniosporium apollinis CBS 100218]
MPHPKNANRIFYPSYHDPITFYSCLDPKNAFAHLMDWLYNKPNLPDFWIDTRWSTHGPLAHANQLYFIPNILRGGVSVLCFRSFLEEVECFLWVRCSLKGWLSTYAALRDQYGIPMMMVQTVMRRLEPGTVRRTVFDKAVAWLEWLEREDERNRRMFPDVQLNVIERS